LPAPARRLGSRAHTPGKTACGASVVRATVRPDRRDRLPRPRRAPRHLQRLRSATIDNVLDLDNEEQAPPWTCAATVGSWAKLWPRLRSLKPLVIDADGNVARAMYGVKPEAHADEVLEALPG
jgi:hypothetical protein